MNLKENILKIKGMDCPDCATGIEKKLKELQGIKNYSFMFSSEKLALSYDENEINFEAIKQAIQKLGYKIEDGEKKYEKGNSANIIVFAFVSILAILILAEILLERLGILEKAFLAVPYWVLLAATLIGGYPILKNAFKNLINKSVTTDLIMSVGIGAAAFTQEFSAALLIVFFVRIAHFLETFTIDRSRQAIKELIKLSPKTAIVKRDHTESEVPIGELKVGDIIIVKPGANIPTDGKVIKGTSAINQSAITGESLPVEKHMGSEVYAGTINQRGSLEIEVTRIGADTTLGKIITLVEEAESHKAPVQKFADRFSTFYLPFVILVAVLTYLITKNLSATIAVLVVACPCAVALATPMAVVAAVGRSAKQGILIKGGRYLEILAKANVILVDKTGTLTFGQPKITDIIPLARQSEKEIIALAGSIEKYSEHILAKAVLDKAKEWQVALTDPEKFKVEAGMGVIASINNEEFILGNKKLLEEHKVEISKLILEQIKTFEIEGKTILILAKKTSEILGFLAVQDVVRQEAREAINELKQLGFKKIIMLTGDNKYIAEAIARDLDIEYRAELLPHDKIAVVEELQKQNYTVVMVGDGVNDAPALTKADVGIAMGITGTDVALEAADIALMKDDWREVPQAVKIARRTFSTIKQNLAFGIGFDLIGISLAASGFLPPIFAAAAQSFPDVAVFLNSAKLLKRKK